nr:MAG TPA: hypothetical protein [Caudoviricetes sp.]
MDRTSTFRSFLVANQVTTDPIAPPGSKNMSKSFSISKSISKSSQIYRLPRQGITLSRLLYPYRPPRYSGSRSS